MLKRKTNTFGRNLIILKRFTSQLEFWRDKPYKTTSDKRYCQINNIVNLIRVSGFTPNLKRKTMSRSSLKTVVWPFCRYDMKLDSYSSCQLTSVPVAKLDLSADFQSDVDYDFFQKNVNASPSCRYSDLTGPYGQGQKWPSPNGPDLSLWQDPGLLWQQRNDVAYGNDRVFYDPAVYLSTPAAAVPGYGGVGYGGVGVGGPTTVGPPSIGPPSFGPPSIGPPTVRPPSIGPPTIVYPTTGPTDGPSSAAPPTWPTPDLRLPVSPNGKCVPRRTSETLAWQTVNCISCCSWASPKVAKIVRQKVWVRWLKITVGGRDFNGLSLFNIGWLNK